MNGVEDPGVLEGLRLAGVDLCSFRESLQHHLAGLVALIDDHYLDVALPHPLGDSLDGLFGRGTREVFSRLGHILVFPFYNCSTSRINSSFFTEAWGLLTWWM
jgi:hypothetical protein